MPSWKLAHAQYVHREERDDLLGRVAHVPWQLYLNQLFVQEECRVGNGACAIAGQRGRGASVGVAHAQ